MKNNVFTTFNFLKGRNVVRACLVACLLFTSLPYAGTCVKAAEATPSISYLLSAPKDAGEVSGPVTVTVLFMNTGTTKERFEIPSEMTAYITQNGIQKEILIKSDSGKEWVDMKPGTFKSRQYKVPVENTQGDVQISLDNASTISLQLSGKTPELKADGKVDPTIKGSPYITGEMGEADAKLEGKEAKERNAMVDYFSKHFAGYDPIYFLIGANPSGTDGRLRGTFPNARFQVSLRYRLFTEDSYLANKWNGFTNVFITYTQNTEWDLAGESAPFLDTMFKPELQYHWQDIFKEPKGILEKMDLMAAISHESNGRNGAGSRSINYVIARPKLYFGDPERLNGYLAPGFWFYFGSLSDNPSIRHYRGHADVKAAIQWADTIQLASWFRMGDELEKGSMQLDLSYPLGRLTDNCLDLYLDIQYFTGYGQTLLNYNQREQALRAGVMFVR